MITVGEGDGTINFHFRGDLDAAIFPKRIHSDHRGSDSSIAIA